MYPTLTQHVRQFVSLDETEAETLTRFARPIAIKNKAYLLKEGQHCKTEYFVEQGCLRKYFITDKGTEQITQFALEHWWLADYASLLYNKPSQFYIQSVEPSTVLCFDIDQQPRLFDRLPQMERYFRLIALKANAAAQQRIKFLHDFSKEESYRHFSQSFPAFVQRIPQYMLASYLGLTPEYLSEIRKKK